MNKKLILFLSISMFGTLSIFAQTPYDNFAPEQSVKSMIELSKTPFRLIDSGITVEIRYADFDKTTLSLILLDDNESMIKTLVFNSYKRNYSNI